MGRLGAALTISDEELATLRRSSQVPGGMCMGSEVWARLLDDLAELRRERDLLHEHVAQLEADAAELTKLHGEELGQARRERDEARAEVERWVASVKVEETETTDETCKHGWIDESDNPDIRSWCSVCHPWGIPDGAKTLSPAANNLVYAPHDWVKP